MLLFEDIAAGKYEVPDWVEPDCADLIRQMLHTNPVERIDLPAIKQHAFVKTSLPKNVPSIAVPTTASMWPNHDRATLSSVIKKLKPQLERQQAQERAERFAFNDDEEIDPEDDYDLQDDPNAPSRNHSRRNASDGRSSSSKCSVM